MDTDEKMTIDRDYHCDRFPGLPCSVPIGVVIVLMVALAGYTSFNTIVANCILKPCPITPEAILQSTSSNEVVEASEPTREISAIKEQQLIIESAAEDAAVSISPPILVEEVILDVPIIEQLPELPTGCEATSVTMLLNYAGVEISKFEVVELMPYSDDDPRKGFVGDPYSINGWTIYPEALSELVMSKAGSYENLTGSELDAIRTKLSQGCPVVCWMNMHGFYVHAVTVSGYDSDYFYFNDPWTGEKDSALNIDEFRWAWKDQGFRALSY